MYGRGFLVLSNSTERRFLDQSLLIAKTLVRDKLFISFPDKVKSLGCWKSVMSMCYTSAFSLCPSIDVCFLLPQSNNQNIQFDVLLSHAHSREQAFQEASILHTSSNVTPAFKNLTHCTVDSQTACSSSSFDNVCLGGTFDRLHNGHKILLSLGALLANQRLLVGITADSVLGKKTLAPLITSYATRCEAVRTFLDDIGFPLSKLELACLTDAFGPPASDSAFECIISSPDTITNCVKLNEVRTANGMNPLKIEEIPLVTEQNTHQSSVPSAISENKLSSSHQRFHLLGSLLRPANKAAANRRGTKKVYVIGLVGPSGAGKSSLAARLLKLSHSVHVLDCDRLGHDAYKPGTACYEKIITHFGYDAIVCPEPPHLIDRSRLGKLVFSNTQNLATLNALVWPEIKQMILDTILRLDDATNSGAPTIVVLDAAVLLQAGWDELCDEIWLATIPKDEALRRICERAGLDETSGNERLSRQASAIAQVTGGLDWWEVGQVDTGRGPLGKANVVLCTLWEPECSQRQIEKAFRGLMERIEANRPTD